MSAEMMKPIEQKGDFSITNIQETAKKMAERIPEDKRKIGEKIKDRIDVLNSTELLKDFSTRPQKNALDMSNPGHVNILEALKNPENKETIQTIQKQLGYSTEGKIYYNPCRNDIKDGGSIRNKTPDGKAGAFTIGAINNMIADNKEEGVLKIRDNISTLDGVHDFIGSLHDYFYNRLTESKAGEKIKGNDEEKNEGKKVIETIQKIVAKTAQKGDIQTMQNALNNLKSYPSIHNKEQKDGVPGPFTQIALQNFVFKYLQ